MLARGWVGSNYVRELTGNTDDEHTCVAPLANSHLSQIPGRLRG